MKTVWQSLQYRVFRFIWIASLISNIGSWMHEVSAAWLMTTLTSKPWLVTLVQATSALSVCLLAIPAGALADILDKRRYLIFLQTCMMIIAATLAILTFMGKIAPSLLLFLTFCLGAGTGLNAPTWQALVPHLVPKQYLLSAIALNSMSVNISRTLGPIFAGMIIALSGPAAVFAINAISFLGLIITLSKWQYEQPATSLPAERFLGAMRSGIRYVKGSPILIKVLIKSSANFIFISIAWATLPLIARNMLHLGPIGYGILLGMLGLGAVFGALLIHKIREKTNLDNLVFLSGIVFAAALLLIAIFQKFHITCFAMYLIGFAWLTVLSTLNSIVQQSVPRWVRARAISVYLMVFFGGMALGGILWGIFVTYFSIPFCLVLASIGLIISNTLVHHLRLESEIIYDHTPSLDLPAPIAETNVAHEDGPVMVTVEYQVELQNVSDFLIAIQELRLTRLREGAFFWTIFKDVEKSKHYVECFMVESWLEHLRFHERVSVSDRKIQAKVNSYLIDNQKPHTTHYVACELANKKILLRKKNGYKHTNK